MTVSSKAVITKHGLACKFVYLKFFHKSKHYTTPNQFNSLVFQTIPSETRTVPSVLGECDGRILTWKNKRELCLTPTDGVARERPLDVVVNSWW